MGAWLLCRCGPGADGGGGGWDHSSRQYGEQQGSEEGRVPWSNVVSWNCLLACGLRKCLIGPDVNTVCWERLPLS